MKISIEIFITSTVARSGGRGVLADQSVSYLFSPAGYQLVANRQAQASPGSTSKPGLRELLARTCSVLALILAVFAVYSPVHRYAFMDPDDNNYVTNATLWRL